MNNSNTKSDTHNNNKNISHNNNKNISSNTQSQYPNTRYRIKNLNHTPTTSSNTSLTTSPAITTTASSLSIVSTISSLLVTTCTTCTTPVTSTTTSHTVNKLNLLSSEDQKLLKTDDCIEKLTTSQLLDLNKKLDRMNSDLQRQIADINLVISQLLENKGMHPRSSESETLSQLEMRVEHMERRLICDEIVIDGIPIVNDSSDNGTTELNYLCSKLDYTLPTVKYIRRIRNKKFANKDGSVIIKFNNLGDKIKFKNAIKKFVKENKRSLILSDVGFQSNKRIYIHDRLTKSNYQLYRHALKFKAQKKIQKVYIYRGGVHIVQTEGGNPVYVTNFDNLKALVNAEKEE